MAHEYTSLDAYKAEYDIQREDHDALITGMLSTASRLVDSICRRRFYVNGEETISYDYVKPRYLDLREDLYSLTSISNGDGSDLSSEVIVLYPGHGPPYGWIELKHLGDIFLGDGVGNRQCIGVVGEWGYCNEESRPDAVKRAALMLTNWLYRNPEAIAKGVGPARIGQDVVLELIPAAVLVVLDHYIREWFGAHDMWTSQRTWW